MDSKVNIIQSGYLFLTRFIPHRALTGIAVQGQRLAYLMKVQD
jgi:hypothetical protein